MQGFERTQSRDWGHVLEDILEVGRALRNGYFAVCREVSESRDSMNVASTVSGLSAVVYSVNVTDLFESILGTEGVTKCRHSFAVC